MFNWKGALTCAFLALFVVWTSGIPGTEKGVYRWMERDNFDVIIDRLSEVTAENCRAKPKSELTLPKESVTQYPMYNKLLSSVIHQNRSTLLHLHNMALNRAFFYSFIYQAQNMSVDFFNQPGFMYLYMSNAADVTAGAGFVNGSGLYFDNNVYYPNWWTRIVDFNSTLPLYGPRAWRVDDYDEATNWLREPTNNTVDIHDYAAGRSSNYSSQAFKSAPWYSNWLPDISGETDSVDKYTYAPKIRRSNETGRFVKEEFSSIPFFGPPQPGQTGSIRLPVLWTQPYFDCGRSNRWIISASSPVTEYMPRYSNWTHLRRPRFTAVATQDIEFERIDINPCPVSEGNKEPNMFAGTARCKKSTICETLGFEGWGFRRGGYQCACQPGYYYPWWHDGPFLGEEIEQATKEEYENGFDCLPIYELQVPPQKNPSFVDRKKRSVATSLKEQFLSEVMPSSQSARVKLVAKRSLAKLRKKRFVPRFKGEEPHMRYKRDLFDTDRYDRLNKIMDRKDTTTRSNCHTKHSYERFLPGDAAYGVEAQFEAEGRTALRLAHFLSNFLQNVDEYEQFGSMDGDRRLNETHVFGEVIANVMSNFKIVGSGAFFDRYSFRMSPPINNTDPRFSNGITREYFGPYSWVEHKAGTAGLNLDFKAEDFAGHKTFYTDEPWFRNMKARWQTNFVMLKKFTLKPMIRSDPAGTSLIRFEHYPLTFFAPKYEHGEWLRPEFKCDERIMDWVVTYVVPFFGLDSLKSRLEFKGVVTVDVKLDYLQITQCPGPFYQANAFKNTAKCHYQSTYCIPTPGRIPDKRYAIGNYKCECRQGYEYIFNDNAWFYDGQTIENEYQKMEAGLPNRFETLKCRIAGASAIVANWVLIGLLSVALAILNRS
ncbi:uncharacterized protein LOC127724053 [Mytilus californianus]|uniref:uncharacterized protein LOC127724053 n=1 Tax=Mytilus californianus TaxID=6549 RepID=UPI0022458B4B|nr:uncharacterized protein LOC127724053 [Mytilus californianus]